MDKCDVTYWFLCKMHRLIVIAFYIIFQIGLCQLQISAALEQETFGNKFNFNSINDETQVKEGKLNYELIVRDSQMPRYGKCWKEALSELERGCKHLTDDVQGRLALHFANCFLAKAGLETYPCDEDQEISECLNKMTSNGFTAYTNFFTHTQSMCYFLQTQIWQEETEGTIGRLAQSSLKVVQTLEDTNQLQDSILESQRKSLAQQELLLQSSSMLSQALDGSKEDVRDMLEEFRSSTSEQRHLIFEVFDRLAKLQNFVLGEVSGFYSLIFYPTALLTAYLLTSTSRTAAARFWLFVFLGFSLAMERSMIYFTVSEESGYIPADEASNIMYWRIWLIRKAAMTLCLLLLAWTAYKFQDYNIINNALLVQIQRQNQELRNYLETLGIRGAVSKMMSGDVTDFKQSKFESDSSNDSDFSYDSQDSDRTYIPSKLEETHQAAVTTSDDDDTYETAPSRPDSVLLPQIPPPAFSIPEKIEKVVIKSEPKSTKNEIGAGKPVEVKPRASRSRSTTPVQHQSPYNLRSRSVLSPINEANVNKESPEQFGRLVKQMERITRKTTAQIIQKVNDKLNATNNFSSDDE